MPGGLAANIGCGTLLALVTGIFLAGEYYSGTTLNAALKLFQIGRGTFSKVALVSIIKYFGNCREKFFYVH